MTDRYWADTYSASDDGSDAGSEDDMLEVSLRPRPGSLGYEEIVLHSRIIADILQILHNDPRIWREVVVGLEETSDGQSSSPAFLAVLTSLLRKTKRLQIVGGLPDKAAYCTLMAGLMMPESVEEFMYEFLDRPMNEPNAKLLAHGLANSTCLRKFRIQAFRTEDGVGAHLIEGLQSNRYLKKLELNIHRFDNDQTMPNLILALQEHPTLQSLTVQHHEMTSHSMQHLGQYLNQQTCQLQELKILYDGRNQLPRSLPSFSATNAVSIRNTTLQTLHLHHTMISSQYLDHVCHTFSELRHVSLAFNSVSDLSLMASFLCKHECKIQHLNLARNSIQGDAMREFAPKIPMMKSLRRLFLDRNVILGQGKSLASEAALLQLIMNNVEKSRSLECFSFDYTPDCASAARHEMNVNRGGRRGILAEAAKNQAIPMASWPNILHRALSIKYFSGRNRSGTIPNDEKPRASVVFSLLRDHPYILDGRGVA